MSEETLKVKESAIVAPIPLKRVAESEDVVNGRAFPRRETGTHYTGVDSAVRVERSCRCREGETPGFAGI